MKILHLSDLHFGYDKDTTMKTQRDNLLNSLLTSLQKDIGLVLITGDIAWQCKDQGYELAKDWIGKLTTTLEISSEQIIICPGNHDVDQQETAEISYIQESKIINENLKIERMDKLNRRFQKYINFCNDMGFKQPIIDNKGNYLIGTINYDDVKIWVINTSWYALKGGNNDTKQLWIGENFIDLLINEKRANEKAITICMHHHPKDWLNDNETQTDGTDRSLYETIALNCNLNFTGHTHGNIQEPNRYHNNMFSFSAGATYQNSDYSHNYSIFDIDITSKKITRSPYISCNRNEWEPRQIKEYIFSELTTTATTVTEQPVYSESKKLKDLLDKINVNMIRVTENDFSSNKTIIWPVVPRLTLTSIHLAQLELMEILCKKFGWTIQAIISNCSANPLPIPEVASFIEKVKRYCERHSIQGFNYELLSRYFQSNNELAPKILESFTDISSKIKMPDLTQIKEKKYDEQKRAEIRSQPVLDHILPILQFAVVNTLCHEIKKSTGKKSIVLAGNDEQIQWSNAVSAIGEDYLGVLLIPELNKTNGINVNQDTQIIDIKPIIECSSKDALKESLLLHGSIGSWFYRMFVIFSHYDNLDNIDIFKDTPPEDRISFWSDENLLPDCVDTNKLINLIWNRIERGNMSN